MLVIKVMKYNGGIVFQVFPVSQQTEEDTSPVDLFSTLKNLTVGADGDGGKIKDLISDNNEQGMESKVLYKIVKYKEIGCFDPCPITMAHFVLSQMINLKLQKITLVNCSFT